MNNNTIILFNVTITRANKQIKGYPLKKKEENIYISFNIILHIL